MKCYNLFPGGRHKALTLSYDDGVSSDIRMMEIMRRHGIKGTFNVNAGRMDGEGSPYRLRPEEYGAYEGFELAIHGYSHPFLNRMPLDLVIDEIVEDRRAVEKLAGYPVHGMAYPYGAYDDALIEQLRRLGVYYSRTSRPACACSRRRPRAAMTRPDTPTARICSSERKRRACRRNFWPGIRPAITTRPI